MVRLVCALADRRDSPTALAEEVAELALSRRSHGRHLTHRIAALEIDLDQEQINGITSQALSARSEGAVEELTEAQEALRILEVIGPYLAEG